MIKDPLIDEQSQSAYPFKSKMYLVEVVEEDSGDGKGPVVHYRVKNRDSGIVEMRTLQAQTWAAFIHNSEQIVSNVVSTSAAIPVRKRS